MIIYEDDKSRKHPINGFFRLFSISCQFRLITK